MSIKTKGWQSLSVNILYYYSFYPIFFHVSIIINYGKDRILITYTVQCQSTLAQCFMPLIPSIQKVEIRRIIIGGQPRQKLSRIPSEQRRWKCWHTSVITARSEA
jgi:hypothetical protein